MYDENLETYIKETGNTKVLTREEELALFRRIAAGDESARAELIEKNQKLVISIALKLRNKVNSRIALSDLISEGNIGMLKKMDEFDPDKGYKFSTYITHSIRRAMQLYILENSESADIPIHVKEDCRTYNKHLNLLRTKLGRNPTDEELATSMNTTIQRIKNAKKALANEISIDAPVKQDDNSSCNFSDIIVDTTCDTADIVIKNDLASVIEKYLKNSVLDEREIGILKLRYGLNGGEPMNLEDIGKAFDISRERARQLESRALKKLRVSAIREGLHVYLEDSTDTILPKIKTNN